MSKADVIYTVQKESVYFMCSSKFIYKYMSFDKFVALIERQKLYLTRVDHWDDTFEGYLLSHYMAKDSRFAYLGDKLGTKIKKSIFQSMYAQSWTLEGVESDAMWRIYSSDGQGVRIKASISDIQSRIEAGINQDEYMLSNFKVEYANEVSVSTSSTRSDILNKICDGDLIKYALGVKRPAFKHEVEYRFCAHRKKYIQRIYYYINDICKTNSCIKDNPIEELIDGEDVLEYNVSLDSIKEILLDPRAKRSHRDTFEACCKNHGFAETVYRQSQLYRNV